MSIADLATIAAIVIGSSLAVFLADRLTRKTNQREETRKRKWQILRDLLLYRDEPRSKEFIGAINLIELEFNDDACVLEILGSFIRHERKYEKNRQSKSDEVEYKRYNTKSKQLRTDLIRKMARSLNVDSDNPKIFLSGYNPTDMINGGKNT